MFRAAQHGQRESVVARAATNLRRIVAIEFGTWRSGRNGCQCRNAQLSTRSLTSLQRQNASAELEQIDGFVDNIRYRSLTREGWILSLSGWRDEKAVVRWRTAMGHHMVQEKGRTEILLDYRLRVGQITQDTRLPTGHRLQEQRLDETEVGEGTTISLIDARQPDGWKGLPSAPECARYLGLPDQAPGLASWDAFDAVLTAGDLILMATWR